jgi:hypothetical protein
VPSGLCDGDQHTDVRRIMVNGAGPAGLQPQETLTVLLPNELREVAVDGGTEVRRCWYQGGRIYLFAVDVARLESAMVALDPGNAAQRTRYDDARHPRASVPCYQGPREAQGSGAAGDCFTGLADETFAADAPAQLVEYTFDSDNGLPDKDPDTGTPMADIDVSYVDDVYLPVAASVENGGATGYMGSAQPLGTFTQRVAAFQAGGWPVYAAYLEQNWAGNAFSALLPPELGGGGHPPALHLPAGYNTFVDTLSQATSTLYAAGDGAPSYLSSGVLHQATQLQPSVDRWMAWVDGTPCADLDRLVWPDGLTASFDKPHFCARFQATVQAVWGHFLTDKDDGFQDNQARFYKDCGFPPDSPPDQNQTNACVLQHIVGYNSQVLGGELPGQVQALLRGVAYDPQDGAPQYQFDPFLTFASPFASQFSLDPYTRLIHSPQDGVAAVAYSFSIDDKYGNFRDASSGFVVDAGGTTALLNKQPFDPYQQYTVSWGYNRDPFSLVWLQPGVDLAGAQGQLQALAPQHGNRPFLIRQEDRLAVLGHAGGGAWKLTDPLVTRSQLQTLAQQEQVASRGATHVYQDVIDHTFGSASGAGVFPAAPLDPGAPGAQSIGALDFDSVDGTTSSWAAGQEALYGFISQRQADVPALGNWTTASVCGLEVPVTGPGAQRLPLPFGNGAYGACALTLTDSFGQALALRLTPGQLRPVDGYTGASVAVWGLPIGTTYSGDPQTSSNLSEDDSRRCQSSSSLPDLCANVTLSAVWAADPLARDVVYMGLDPRAMPRVYVDLPAAPREPPDPTRVTWPSGAAMTTQAQGDGTVLVSWPAAQVGPGTPLQYLLYVQSGADWNPVPGCEHASTACRATLQAPAGLYVIAVNTTVSPPKQTPQLYGCYPSATPCGGGPPPPSPTPGTTPSATPPASGPATATATPPPATTASPATAPSTPSTPSTGARTPTTTGAPAGTPAPAARTPTTGPPPPPAAGDSAAPAAGGRP